jgi:hypothetical protein
MGGGSKAFLLRAYAEGRDRGGNHLSVPDPFGGDDEVYEGTFRTLEQLIEKALKRLRQEGEADGGPPETEAER